MPRNITVTFADGSSHVYQGAPDDVTPDQAQARAEKEFSKPVTSLDGGRGTPKTGADLIPGSSVKAPAANYAPEPDSKKDGMLGRMFGHLEAPLAVGTGMAGMAAGSLAGLVKGVTSDKHGTPEGAREADQYAGEVASNLTYQPRSQTGRRLTQLLGSAANDSGIVGVAPMLGELSALGQSAPAAKTALSDLLRSGASQASDAGASGAGSLAGLLKPSKPAMRGGGAAVTEDATLRTQRAADLPYPVKLTKGDATRDFNQIQFERETAKLPEGAPLRDRAAFNNEQNLKNLDAFFDETGAQQRTPRLAGQAVDEAARAKKGAARSRVEAAYATAREAGQMAERVDISPLVEYLNNSRSAAKNAPILSAIEKEIDRLGSTNQGGSSSLMNAKREPVTSLSINNSEELRKMINRLAEPGTPNLVYGSEAKKLIDAATQGKGGPLYQQARRMYENYSNEFKDRAVIDKLLRDKPGTKDRTVAYEDVMNHTLLDGSLDDARHVFRVLEAHPAGTAPEIVASGQQAARELRGAFVNHIKETVFSNSARDVNGNPILSPAKLDKLVRTLDADGKLDLILGKKGAERIRDVNDMAKDLYTTPPGSVNSSNTSTALLAALDLSSSAFTGLPLPIATTLNYGIKRVKGHALQKKVENALGGSGQP